MEVDVQSFPIPGPGNSRDTAKEAVYAKVAPESRPVVYEQTQAAVLAEALAAVGQPGVHRPGGGGK